MRRVDPPSPTPPRPSVTRPAHLEAAAQLAARRARLRAEQRAEAEADEALLETERGTKGAVELRLAIGKDGLGIELAHPTTLACLSILELVVRLPSVKFPFDVSGGITRFRHKRGELERVSLELDARRFARWAEPRLRGLVSAGPCSVALTARAFGATLTVHARTAVSHAAPRGELPALVFEVSLVPAHGDLTLAVHGARGAHLLEPATVLALRAVQALLGESARREGGRFVVPDAGGLVARALLPDAGVRAPGTDDVRLAGSGAGDGVLFAAFVRGGSPAKAPAEAALAAETALLTRDADDARVRGDLDLARQLDLAALERAPRHPEIARRIAEIDRHVGGRADAANAILRDVEAPVSLGLLAGELLAEAGDEAGAVAALLRAGEHEPSDVLAALA
ncbi:MAG: domain protein putative component of TonB system, partial [Labilithrix sp.]|nr:domain protein putative component of TonB system [Labilithrix sp.]